MEGWSVLSSGRRHHSLLQTQPNPPLLPLSPSDSPNLSPVDPDSPSTMSNSPCHTPQLDPCLERLCECVCYREGEERRGERVWLVSWCLPPAVTQYLGNCVCLCVCVWAKRAGSWGTILPGCCAITCQAEDMSPKGW